MEGCACWGGAGVFAPVFHPRKIHAVARLLAMVPSSQSWMADFGCGRGSAPARLRYEPCLGVDRSRRMVRASCHGEAGRALCADLAVPGAAGASFSVSSW